MSACAHDKRWTYRDGAWVCGDCGAPCDAPDLGFTGEELRAELLREREEGGGAG